MEEVTEGFLFYPSCEFSVEWQLMTMQGDGSIVGNFTLQLGSSRLTLRHWAVHIVTHWKAEQYVAGSHF